MSSMSTTPRMFAVMLASSLLLAAAVGTATARNYSFSNQNIRATWTRLSFEGGAGIILSCQLTLEGSFHRRTITKVARSLIGAITRVRIKEEACTNGTLTPRNETLPWHLTYEGFTGSLPDIVGILLLFSRFRFGLDTPGGICTADYGIATDNITLRIAVTSGEVPIMFPVEGRSTATREGAGRGICQPITEFRGTGVVTLLAASTRIRVLLI
jgi:hypothetical protein